MSEARTDQEIALITRGNEGTLGTASCLETVLPTVSRDDHLLVVTYTQLPDQVHDHVTDAAQFPAALGVITANDGIRSSGGAAVNESVITPDSTALSMTIETVPPGNLTRLGVRITEFLKQWEESDGRILLCFDSLTVLSQHVQDSTLLRFLHVLTGQLRAVDAGGYFLVDPDALSDTTVAQAKTIVDTVIEIRPAAVQSGSTPPSTNE